jgi:hypothetical protein
MRGLRYLLALLYLNPDHNFCLIEVEAGHGYRLLKERIRAKLLKQEVISDIY